MGHVVTRWSEPEHDGHHHKWQDICHALVRCVSSRAGQLPLVRRADLAISVVSLYDEDIDQMADTVRQVTERLRGTTRVIVYSKAERNASDVKEILKTASEVVPLPNIGREGETYLVSGTRSGSGQR